MDNDKNENTDVDKFENNKKVKDVRNNKYVNKSKKNKKSRVMSNKIEKINYEIKKVVDKFK